MMTTEIFMPQLGESVVEGTVSAWLKREGERVERFEPLLVIETDKVTTEIPSPAAGILQAIHVREGQTVAKGVLLGVIGESAAVKAPASVPAPAPWETPGSGDLFPVPEAAAPSPQVEREGHAFGWHVTPVVARMAAEHQLDLAQMHGSGRGGRVTKKDVEAFLADRPAAVPPRLAAAAPTPAPVLPPVPPVPPPQPGDGELVPLTPMRKTIAERMIFSRSHYAHVTTVWEIDLTRALAHRAAHKAAAAHQGVNLTLTAYFAAAAISALRAVPVINAEYRDDGIYLHHHQHLGIAVALEGGLIVPVLRDAGDLSLIGLARGINDLSQRARSGLLRPDEVRGGTFTLTNHGVSGSLFATPIITPPQVGILGVGVMEQRVKVIDGMIAIRSCVYASLTFDHRAADGAMGDAFMAAFKQALEQWA